MRGAVSVIEFVLLSSIVVSLTAWSMPWATKIVTEALDVGEISTIRPQFEACSKKIIETARTGVTNKCVFSISRGEIIGRKEGVEYSITSFAPICDPHPLILIDKDNHLYQRCDVSADSKTYEMFWMFPVDTEITGSGLVGDFLDETRTPISDIDFSDSGFTTLTLFVEFEYGEGESGNNVMVSRKSVSSDKIDMTLKIF